MNHIEAKCIMQCRHTEQFVLIDCKSILDYLNLWKSELDEKTLAYLAPFDDLYPAWGKNLDWYGDVRFVWNLIEKENVNLPVLLCPDDLDFTCIVIVVQVEKTKDFVYWRRIGYVNHANEEFKEERKNGILNLNAYSDRDWSMYGDNIALADVDSSEWREWISDNWDEELYRRRLNYTFPYYQTMGNVFWFHDLDWTFDRYEYELMTNAYWKTETIKQLSEYMPAEKLTVKKCAYFISTLTQNGRESLAEHLYDYGEILLHVFASEIISEPLIVLLKKRKIDSVLIQIYCKAIELMWEYGNDAVINVVDVTILERLSDEKEVWQLYGTYITKEFKKYINEEVLKQNLMMGGVEPLL